MKDIIREAPFGQVLRFVTGKRVLKYPEEEEDFECPKCYRDPDSVPSPPSDEEKSPNPANDDNSPELEGLETKRTNISGIHPIHTRHDSAEKNEPPALIRTRTREATRAWTRERFDVERDEEQQRELDLPIIAQRNSEGDILVDWYNTDDPANPQNWSSKKKAFVGLQIL